MISYRTLVWLCLIGVIGIFLYVNNGTNICDKQLTDNEYITHMITHHEVAVYMSENHLHTTKNPVMLNILRNLIRLQKYEISIMKDSKISSNNISNNNNKSYIYTQGDYVNPNTPDLSNTFCDPGFFNISHNKNIHSNLSCGHPFGGPGGCGGPGGPGGFGGFGGPGGFGGLRGGNPPDVDIHVKNLRTIYSDILKEMKNKGKDLVDEDKKRIELAIKQIETNNKQVLSALGDLKSFIKLDNVFTNGLGNSINLDQIKSLSKVQNIRKSISNLENSVNTTSRDQIALITALIEQVYRPMLLVASGAATPFMRVHRQ